MERDSRKKKNKKVITKTVGGNPEEIAIKLAKRKWGETSESYVFTMDQIEGKNIPCSSKFKCTSYRIH